MGWTDEKVQELTRLWNEGLTTGEIGKKLGVSKNAVVGKAHRLGLKSRPSPIKRPAPKKKKAAAKPKQKAAPKQKVTIMDLTGHTCRWPIGDPRDDGFHFCGKHCDIGTPYCKDHASQAYVTSNR